MLICGIQKLTLLDYPEKIAATIFTGGCNYRCPFCHNASLVLRPAQCQPIPEEEIFDFLKKRVGKLDGVCITGGEPLLQPDLESFIRRVRDMGFLIKLDTNGAFPQRLKALLDQGLLDYVAVDIKNSPEKYPLTVGLADFDPSPVFESAALLMTGKTPYEFRTTLVRGLHTSEDIAALGKAIKGAKNCFLQSFIDSGDLVGFPEEGALLPMGSFTEDEIKGFRDILSQYVENAAIRG